MKQDIEIKYQQIKKKKGVGKSTTAFHSESK